MNCVLTCMKINVNKYKARSCTSTVTNYYKERKKNRDYKK